MFSLYICLAVALASPSHFTYARTLHRFQMNSPACKTGVPITVSFDAVLEDTIGNGEVDTACGSKNLAWDALPLGKDTNSICDKIASTELGPSYETTYRNMYLTQAMYSPGLLSAYADKVAPEYSDLVKIIHPYCGMILYREKYTEKRTWHKCDNWNCFVEGESTMILRDGTYLVGKDQHHTKGMCLKICRDLQGGDHFGNFGDNPARDCLIVDNDDCMDGYIGNWPHLGEAVRKKIVDITPDGACAYQGGNQGPFLMTEAATAYQLETSEGLVNELEQILGETILKLEERINKLEKEGLGALTEEEENSSSFALAVAGVAMSGTLIVILIILCIVGMVARRKAPEEE